jgi:hypothetical protein
VIPVPPNLPGTRPDDPMPPLLAVRALLAKHADVASFDADVEAALIEAERGGDFRVLREAIAGHLWSAICAEHVSDIAHMPANERTELLRGYMLKWIEANQPPPFQDFLRSVHARLNEPLPDVDGPMRGFLTDPEDEEGDPPAPAAAPRP